jgi:hypothetical protein
MSEKASYTYEALVQLMDDLAEGKPVSPEDWEIVRNWMHMMEEQVTE